MPVSGQRAPPIRAGLVRGETGGWLASRDAGECRCRACVTPLDQPVADQERLEGPERLTVHHQHRAPVARQIAFLDSAG